MAADPRFAGTPNNGAALLQLPELNLQSPARSSTVFTAGSNGSKVEEVVVEATATSLAASTSAGLVYLFVHDGTTFHLYDVITVPAITASATVPPFRQRNVYPNLILESGWSLRASQAGNNSILKVHAFGGDF